MNESKKSRFPWKISLEEEFKRNPKLTPEALETFKQWYKNEKHLPPVDDEMLFHFLHACYYNVEQAKITIDYFYTYKNTMPEFFEKWDVQDKDIQDAVNNTIISAPLPMCTSEGYRVIVCKLNDTDVAKFNYPICVKWLAMSCIHAIWERGTQNGYVIVYDAAGFTMSHLFKCPLSTVKNYINYGKNASPIRVLKVVFINTSPVVKKLLTLVKPFLSKELINMMSFHISPDSFFQDLEKANIPEDYGGEAPPLLSLHREYVKIISSAREWLIEEEKVKCDEKLRVGKSKKDVSQKIDISFKKLEID
uniref:Alpha-tocopherol transfer protein n=1 Tax=Triatoma infestans TaxID=30076 RepID=A0A161ME35_TRIIF